jgi:hypothetical protein
MVYRAALTGSYTLQALCTSPTPDTALSFQQNLIFGQSQICLPEIVIAFFQGNGPDGDTLSLGGFTMGNTCPDLRFA